MSLHKQLLTKNNCYIAGKKIMPQGVMLHSTGADNPYLKRYIQPDDGLLGKNTNGNDWNQAMAAGQEVCVHAFIGKLADGTVATYQTLPWDMRGWHCGSGPKGSGNDTHIGFEIAEDGLTDSVYFAKVYQEAVELCVMLCQTYGIKPEKPYLICHSEGYTLGITSNHADVLHWFSKHGQSMDTFRADVKKAMEKPTTKAPAEITADNALADGIITDRAYWLGVLTGSVTPSKSNIKALMDKAHRQLQG
ncbi:MAG: peptidoglycan recognition protein family protein [Firmicutes bacterium]|nr:peptidoglycan recognition protein family protein [Bacillota bacterium]